MNILIVGHDLNLRECSEKFGPSHQYSLAKDQQDAEEFFGTAELIFDFVIQENPSQIEIYKNNRKAVVFLNTSTITLAQLTSHSSHLINCTLFGFCGMPTFLNRELLEVSLRSETDSIELKRICKDLNTDYVIVDDRVGLVTPRVICMIINEAYYTVQEGTATREDIDIAMKLGTNYPFGPFEWCEKIGIRNIHQLLNSVYLDTKDERYKICPLLEKEFLITPQ
jgi:3-hydroxybutyryl-CoA dehydrogenase